MAPRYTPRLPACRNERVVTATNFIYFFIHLGVGLNVCGEGCKNSPAAIKQCLSKISPSLMRGRL